MYKLIGADQKEYGPVSAEQLRQWLAEGRVNAQTQVMPEGTTEWKALGSLPEFAGVAPAAAPVLPTMPSPPLDVAERVNGPAIGLMVTAGLGALLQIASLIFRAAGPAIMANSGMSNPAFANMFSGTLGMLSSVIGLLVSGFIFFGAMKMRSLENYGLAMAASIIAMIPCFSPCCLLGLPIGIWALVILSKPEVKSAFH
jgi:hypothetical protein